MIKKSVPIIKRKSADGQDEVCVSTPNFDRGNDRVFPEGCVLDNYSKNPVIFWIHDYAGRTPAAGIPVAKCPYVRLTSEGVISGPPQFLEGDPFAMRVKNAWDQGFIKTASIGFAPLEEPIENDRGGYDYHKWEMLEWSFAPIPMNAEAMRIAKSINFPELVAQKRSQAEIKDELDYCLALLNDCELNESNEVLAKQVRDILTRRYPADDTAVNIDQFAQAIANLKLR